jgi:hypothetical protein
LELNDRDRQFMLATCCSDIIAAAIRATASDRADALLALEALVDQLRQKIERRDNNERTHH